MAQQQQEVKQAAVKKSMNAQAAMMSELKSKVKTPKESDNRKIKKDEMYHGALEDILTGNSCHSVHLSLCQLGTLPSCHFVCLSLGLFVLNFRILFSYRNL